MGLDIVAYRKLVKVDNPPTLADDDELPDGFWRPWPAAIAWAEEHFPGRSEGIDPNAVYRLTSEDGEHLLEFKAGSYSGYGAWRDRLAQLAGHGDREARHASPITGPFAELIDFADNEGVIGPIVSAKLAKDFAAWEAEFERRCPADDRDWFMHFYRLWRRAFEMAADEGAVDFC